MINIREHARSDIDLRVKWLNNRAATLFAVENPDRDTTIKEQQLWFDRYEENEYKKFFTIEVDGKPIGFMGLSQINNEAKRANVFILIGEDDYRGKGYGSRAMSWLIDYAWAKLQLDALDLEVNKKNIAAIKLNESLGFKMVSEDGTELTMVLQKKDSGIFH